MNFAGIGAASTLSTFLACLVMMSIELMPARIADGARNLILIAVTAYVVVFPICSAAVTALPLNVLDILHARLRVVVWFVVSVAVLVALGIPGAGPV